MRVQLAWTMLTELAVMISGVLLLKLLADFLGPAGFGEYNVGRRAVSLMYLPLFLGLGIAAPRYIAMVRARALSRFDERSFVGATMIAGLGPALLVAAILNLAPRKSSLGLFGSETLAHLVLPSSVALAGLAIHSMAYAVYRGQSRMGHANTLQLVNLAVVPIAVFGFVERSAASLLIGTGILWCFTSLAALVHVVVDSGALKQSAAGLRAHMTLLLKFGVPRVPGEFALVGLFAIPALVAVREHGVVAAGYLSAAMSMLTLAAGAFAPVGLVILPRASAQAATGDVAGLRRMVVPILGVGILLASLGVIVAEAVIPPFVRWYFGDEFAPSIPLFRTTMVGAVPYTAYVLMRNVLDALDVKAVNSRNLLIALGTLILLFMVNTGLLWMAGSLVTSLLILGVLTVRATWLRLRPGVAPAQTAIPA